MCGWINVIRREEGTNEERETRLFGKKRQDEMEIKRVMQAENIFFQDRTDNRIVIVQRGCNSCNTQVTFV